MWFGFDLTVELLGKKEDRCTYIASDANPYDIDLGRQGD
jgi:hypothetical protein